MRRYTKLLFEDLAKVAGICKPAAHRYILDGFVSCAQQFFCLLKAQVTYKKIGRQTNERIEFTLYL